MPAPYLQLVVKVSKFCNLRCRYCYEYPSLADRSAMSTTDIRAMLHHLAEFAKDPPVTLDFVWHGGEPLLQPVSLYREILTMQNDILGNAGIQFSNSIQTNLTVLDAERIALLKDMFTEVGVSIDLFGKNRVDSKGRDAQDRILNRMQQLLDSGVHFGCITVLSQATAPYIDEIYDFFEDVNLSFRLLPIYRSGYAGQLRQHELGPDQIVTALKRAAERWLASDRHIRVEPIYTYMANVVHKLSSGRTRQRFYDKADGEAILIIDTDGAVFSNGDAYDQRVCHGNIFRESIATMKTSPAFQTALVESRARVASACPACAFYGSCSGFFMAEATPEQRWIKDDGAFACLVARPLHAYLEARLAELNLLNESAMIDGRELYRRALSA